MKYFKQIIITICLVNIGFSKDLKLFSDTLQVSIPLEKMDSIFSTYSKRFEKSDLDLSSYVYCKENPNRKCYQFLQTNKQLFSKIDVYGSKIDTNNTQLEIKTKVVPIRELQDLLHTNVISTIKQQLGESVPEANPINRKSNITNLGLLILNNGFAVSYSSKDNITSNPPKWVIWFNGLAEGTFLFFSIFGDEKARETFPWIVGGYKVLGLLSFFSLNNHNGLVETNFRYEF